MPISDMLKRLDEAAQKKLLFHRANIRRAYMIALGDIVGMASFDEKDDLCLDTIDQMLEGLSVRGGMMNATDPSMPEGFARAAVRPTMPKADEEALQKAMSPVDPFNPPGPNVPTMEERRRAGNRTVRMADGSPTPGEAQE